MKKRTVMHVWLTVSILTALLAGLALTPPNIVQAVSANLVISQVYGGGGNTGAQYTHDFVELFNRGSSVFVPRNRSGR